MAVFFQLPAVTITNVAQDIIANLAGNQRPAEVIIQNKGTQPIYIGDSTVTSANGLEILSGGHIRDTVRSLDKKIYALTASGTANVRITADQGTPGDE